MTSIYNVVEERECQISTVHVTQSYFVVIHAYGSKIPNSLISFLPVFGPFSCVLKCTFFLCFSGLINGSHLQTRYFYSRLHNTLHYISKIWQKFLKKIVILTFFLCGLQCDACNAISHLLLYHRGVHTNRPFGTSTSLTCQMHTPSVLITIRLFFFFLTKNCF